jgi:hypothetical protein
VKRPSETTHFGGFVNIQLELPAGKERIMKVESMNRKVALKPAERDAIVRSLVSKGIDEDLVRSAIASVASDDVGCSKTVNCLLSDPCSTYFKIDPNALNKLKRELDAKGIKMTNVDPAVAKLFR